MPRRSRHGHAKAVQAEPVSEEFQRRERAKVFERTKMCKFHILGCCSRGAACHFAHTKEELMSQPDLARTKLCKTLISTGQCTDPECRYAHSKEELRLVLGFNCASGNSNSTSPAPSPELGGAMPPLGPLQNCQLPPSALPASMLGEEGCMLNPMLQQAAMQQLVQEGAFQPNAVQQAALQQLAEAAQAHAAEAMRLKAMAACLQGSGFPMQGGSGLPPQFAMAPFMAGGGNQGFHAMPYPVAAPQQGSAAQAPPAAGREKWGKGGKGKGRGAAERPERPGLFKPAAEAISSAGFMAGSYVGGDAEGADLGLAPPEAFGPSEPVQINPLSLRSLSNCSLVDMAKAAAEADSDSSGQEEGAGHGWTVKNTFLDFDAAASPTPGRLRTICSAAGRLNTLAEGSASTSPELSPQELGEGSRGLGRLQLPPTCEEPHALQAPAPQAGRWGRGPWISGQPAGPVLGAEELAEASGSASSPLAPGAALVPPAIAEGITVKNTFLDFAAPARTTLRAVQTAAGRLDLLVGQEDGDEDY